MPTVPNLSVAHEARSIAEQLIREHHTHLSKANILYVFTDQRRKRCDRVRLGSAGKLNALQRFLASGLDSVDLGPDFVIIIDQGEWADLTLAQRHALVDHELCHCALFVRFTGNDAVPGFEGVIGWVRWTPDIPNSDSFEDQRWGIHGHDLEEFSDVIKRHGFWKADIKGFADVAVQLVLPKSERKPA